MGIVILYALDKVMRRLQPWIRDDDDMHGAALFDVVDFFAFFIEQVSCAFDRDFRQYLARIIL